jgi:hypothetical protein
MSHQQKLAKLSKKVQFLFKDSPISIQRQSDFYSKITLTFNDRRVKMDFSLNAYFNIN